MSDREDELGIAVHGHLGRLVLNRPKAINALTLPMIRRMSAALDDWEDDPAVASVLIEGSGERGLCAGGDIIAIRDAALADPIAARAFYAEEYGLVARILAYPKPVVVFMDGIVFGGGVGLAGFASHRVATERLSWAMPEVQIGFCPDTGGTWLLGRAPGNFGVRLGLTGDRIGAGDAIACGFADVFVESSRLSAVRDDLAMLDAQRAVERGAMGRGAPPGAPALADHVAIDACFDGATVAEIVAALTADGSPAAAAVLAAMRTASPTSLEVALRSIRRARQRAVDECLSSEYDVSSWLLLGPDFLEGVRAAVIDKDREPRWVPCSIDEVAERDLERLLGPAPQAILDET